MSDYPDRTGRAGDARHGILDLCTPTLVVVAVTHGNEAQPFRQACIDVGDGRNDHLAALVFREWIAQRPRLVRGTDDDDETPGKCQGAQHHRKMSVVRRLKPADED